MNVLMISANREDINMLTLPMGLACVAAAVEKAGHAVSFLDLLSVKDIPAAVEDAIRLSQPEAIGVSVRNIDDQIMDQGRFLLDQAKEVVRLCREFSAAPIVLGGAGYSIFPESALEYLGADMGIQGEGEAAFPMLLERIEARQDLAGIPGLHLPGKGLQGPLSFIRDLDGVPYPEPAIFAGEGWSQTSTWLPLQTRRGCPLDCSYCSGEGWMNNKITGVVALVLVFVSITVKAQNVDKEIEAVTAAEDWLALVDAGKYGDSWKAASGYLKNAVKQGQWEQSLKAVRPPLGKLVSRKLLSKTFMTSLPGAPDGEYLVIQFDTSFQNKKSAVETITPMKEKDGKWRVSGYYIK